MVFSYSIVFRNREFGIDGAYTLDRFMESVRGTVKSTVFGSREQVYMEAYGKDPVSTAFRVFQENNDTDEISVIKNAVLADEFNNHDNWNGGIDLWDVAPIEVP